MRDLGLPKGIGDQLIASTRDFAMRYWIIDNSGSMKAQSGHRVVRGAGGREGMVACSRWEELGEGIKWHAAMAAHLRRAPAAGHGRVDVPRHGRGPRGLRAGLERLADGGVRRAAQGPPRAAAHQPGALRGPPAAGEPEY